MKTKVCFRKFPEGDVIALFPEVITNNIFIESYQHVGQHGGADVNLITELETVSPREYYSLYNELLSIGYVLEVI